MSAQNSLLRLALISLWLLGIRCISATLGLGSLACFSRVATLLDGSVLGLVVGDTALGFLARLLESNLNNNCYIYLRSLAQHLLRNCYSCEAELNRIIEGSGLGCMGSGLGSSRVGQP